MGETAHRIPLPDDEAGRVLRTFLAPAIAQAFRAGLLDDYCTRAGRVVRAVGIYPTGRVALLPD